jgi:general stress protein 26
MLVPKMAGELNLKNIWSHFKDFQHVCLATVEDNQPRVRPVTLVHFDGKFWITTDTKSAKTNQIRLNQRVEFCLLFKEGDMDCCIRVSGLAKIIKDRATRAKIAKHCAFFSEHWKSVDDPNYTLLEICPTQVTYVSPKKTLCMKI